MTRPVPSATVAAPVQSATAQGNGSLVIAAFFALGTFAIGTEGFMIAPLLPRMAEDFGMSISATASLVIAFTLALSISAPVTTVLTGRFNRRDTLIAAMAAFTVANLIAALSTGFATLIASRLLMAVAAGLYVPNANALAGAAVAPNRRGRALAIVSGGMTIAIALGLPLGSVIGQAFGWRATFLTVTAMGAVAILGIALGVDRQAGAEMRVASIGERLTVVTQRDIRGLLAVTLLWSIAAYCAYPYIAPYLASVLGFGDRGVGATVSLWGVFAALGVMTGGTLNDRFGSPRVVRVSLLLLAGSFWMLAVCAFLAPGAALLPVLAAIAIWGFSVWSFFPAQMARLIGAGSPQQASVSLSLNTSTMYLGFSIGSAIGAGILGTGALWAIGLFAGSAALASWLFDSARKGPPAQP
ncbi:MFS transporter [Paracidovorax citrulli]